MGFFFASIGFSSAVPVARVWQAVAQEAHCNPACPSFALQALRLHHFYYGLGLILPSIITLAFTGRQRVRWDASLILGIGLGLFSDEAALLLVGVPYGSPLSFLILTFLGICLAFGAIHSAFRDGTREFHVLDQADILTASSILLAMSGILYLDRPLQTIAETTGLVSWISALVLFGLYGKRHFLRVWSRPSLTAAFAYDCSQTLGPSFKRLDLWEGLRSDSHFLHSFPYPRHQTPVLVNAPVSLHQPTRSFRPCRTRKLA